MAHAPHAAPVLACALLVAAGCGPGRRDVPAFSTRDSAGVVIADNIVAPVEPGPWTLSADPVLQIGEVTGQEAYLFARIRGVVRLSDGRIAVADNRAPDLRIFGADGRHERTFGRKGGGPGEFQSPSILGVLPGDTIVVVDGGLRRISLFHPDAGFIRSATPDDDVPGYLLPVGMFASGAVVDEQTVLPDNPEDGYGRRPVEYRVVSLDGELVSDMGRFSGYEVVMASQEDGGLTQVITGNAPFGKSPAAAVRGDRFYYGAQDTWEIRVLRPDGSVERIIRWNREPAAVTDAQLAAFIENKLSNLPDFNLARRYRRLYRDAPVPERHPAYGSLFVDRLGWLWVEETRLSDDAPYRWTILDPAGRVAGAIDLPPRFRLEDVGADYVLGCWVDELGVNYVRMYALSRPE
jgi:hypothetical protein